MIFVLNRRHHPVGLFIKIFYDRKMRRNVLQHLSCNKYSLRCIYEVESLLYRNGPLCTRTLHAKFIWYLRPQPVELIIPSQDIRAHLRNSCYSVAYQASSASYYGELLAPAEHHMDNGVDTEQRGALREKEKTTTNFLFCFSHCHSAMCTHHVPFLATKI